MISPKDKKNILVVIPARGGSKGVSRKNIRLLGGQPMIAYMIKAAQRSKYVSHVALSSEDDEILRVGKKVGGPSLILVKRPQSLATDKAPTLPVLQHALKKLERQLKLKFDYLVLLQPNAPLHVAKDIDWAIDIMLKKQADSVVSVIYVPSYHPVKMKTLGPDGRLEQLVASMPERIFRRQDLSPCYIRNGGIYVVTRELIMTGNFALGFMCGPKTYPYVVPAERSLDIHSPFELEVAETLLRLMGRQEVTFADQIIT
mgnify:CR=1 FL=1